MGIALRFDREIRLECYRLTYRELSIRTELKIRQFEMLNRSCSTKFGIDFSVFVDSEKI